MSYSKAGLKAYILLMEKPITLKMHNSEVLVITSSQVILSYSLESKAINANHI